MSASLEPGVLDRPGWLETNYRRLEVAAKAADHRALVRVVQLPGGFHLLVGRDLEERERLFGIIANAGQWSLALVIVLGLAGGFFVSRRVLQPHRCDDRNRANHHGAAILPAGCRSPAPATSSTASPINLNAMLERIEA